jgi:predicted PurR-regulated permease PerM
MSIVGCLTGLGACLIGLPTPLALGAIAGLAEFILTIGPILGAVPAVLLAFTEGTHMVVWTLLLYAAIQQLESNLITPLAQQRMVTIPPALLLFAAIALGLLFGSMGLILAGPLTVIGYIAIERLYVRDALAEETALPTD